MIKNNQQYKYAKNKLQEFEKDLKEIHEIYSSDKNKKTLLGQGYSEHITQLKAEIEYYEKMEKSPLPRVLHAHDPAEICRMLVRLRLGRRLTQAQLAARIGCQQADISRLERENYRGYTISQLTKITNILNAKIQLDIIPFKI